MKRNIKILILRVIITLAVMIAAFFIMFYQKKYAHPPYPSLYREAQLYVLTKSLLNDFKEEGILLVIKSTSKHIILRHSKEPFALGTKTLNNTSFRSIKCPSKFATVCPFMSSRFTVDVIHPLL